MREHSITVFPVKPGTPTQGVTARLLLQMPYIKHPIPCPLCHTAIQHNLEAQITELVAQHGGDSSIYVTYEITHPYEQQVQEEKTFPLDSPEADYIRRGAIRDI